MKGMSSRLPVLFLALNLMVLGPLHGQSSDGGTIPGSAAAGGTIPNSTTAGGTLPDPTTAGGAIPGSAAAGGPIPADSNLNRPIVDLNAPVNNLNVPINNLNVPLEGSTADVANPTTSVPGSTPTVPGSATATTAPLTPGATQSAAATGQSMQVYSTAYSPAESGTDPDTAAGKSATGVPLAPGAVAVNPNIIPYGTQFTVNNAALNNAAIAEGAPTDGDGNAIFTATDTGGAVVNETAANANGYANTPVVDFYAPTGGTYSTMENATGSAVGINIVKAAPST
jgi:3D (Asp-Asp-Asp) domain-containing protein